MSTTSKRPSLKTLIGSEQPTHAPEEPGRNIRWYGQHIAELMAPPPGGAAFVIDRDLRYLVAEGDALHAAGLTPETLIGKTMFEALEPTLASRYEPHYRAALQGNAFSFEHDAHGRTYLSRGVPLRDASGVYAALVISYDITDRRAAERLQRRSEELFAALVDNAPYGIYIVDSQFRFRAINKGAAPAFREVTPLLGRDFAEVVRILWPEPFASDIIDRFRHTLATGEPYLAPTFTEARKDLGRIESYHWQIQRLTLPDGTFAVVCYFHDLTEIRQAEAVVAATAERDRFMLELNDRLRTLAQPNEIMSAASEALARQLNLASVGYAEVDADGDTFHVGGELSDGRWPNVSHKNSYRISDFGEGFRAVLHAGEEIFSEDIPADPRGPAGGSPATRAVQVRATAAVPLIKGGRLVAYLYGAHIEPRPWADRERRLFRDVAERTWAAVERARAEKALRDSEARLRMALDASNMGTFVWHLQDDRGEPDARTLALFGLPADGTLNMADALHEAIAPDDRERYAEAVRAAADPDGPGTLREDIGVRHPDGTMHWLTIRARMVFEGYPRHAARLVGMVTDISDRKFNEEAMRQGEERLLELDRRKDEFLAVLAHELRNPLAPIRTGLELIRVAGDTPGAVARVRAIMERQVSHMVRLIDDLLDVSRITSGKIRLQRQPTPLATLVNTAIDANRAMLAESGIALSVALPETPVIVDVDPTRFVQVLSNLLQNAIKFTDSAGRIRVAATLDPNEGANGTVHLGVSDTGVGISADLLPRVFDLFAQGEAESGRSHTGLGIGLALARRLMELHGGSIDAHSDGLGRGSTFTIHLPVSNCVPLPPVAEPASETPTIARRVVVIDDNEDAANAMAMLVTAIGGESRVAYDGETGLKYVLEFRPDIVLLDIGMPGMDGYETCRRIRKELGTQVVIVALTGWGQEQDKQEAWRAGFDAHLTKPADPATLERLLADVKPH